MKILFITDLYPIKKGESHSPVTLHNFVFEWIKQGHEVDVIKPNFIFNSFLRGKQFYPDGFYNYEGVRIFNVNYFTPFFFDVTNKISGALDVSAYDAIVAHMPSGIIFANKLANIYKKSLVCGVHSSDIEVLTKPIYSFYFKKQLKEAYQNAKKIACRSNVLQKKFNEILPELAEKTFVAASGIVQEIPKNKALDILYPRPLRQRARRDNKNSMILSNAAIQKESLPPISVVTCANLIKRKNIDKLILAINDLDGFELTVIGCGKELKRLKKLAGKNVKFLGQLPNRQVLEEMKKTDIFILPSVNETFGMVYLEAMTSGCITVGTKNDGIDGIIKDGENGFLCEPTPQGIKEVLLKIKTLGENAENIEQILKNSLKTIEDYTPANCAKNYLKNII